ncbi:MAG: hypothetical protein JST26_09195 [Bacteroidetes bacterium]|nr:hypothetical protein [Bacteroidota bacterium]
MADSLKAQFYNLPNDYIYNTLAQRRMARIDSIPLHNSIQPAIPFFNPAYRFVADTFRIFKYITDDPFLEKVIADDLIHIRDRRNKRFEFRVDPLLNFEGGRAFYDTTSSQHISVNTRGFIASGTIGKDFYFETMFAENQAIFPAYIMQFNNQTKIVPGQGRWKNFKSNGYDYAFSSGFVSYQPIKQVNIQVGHGKQEIGNGYRSLLLSDNAFNYPYARITSGFWKGRIQYTNIYAVMMNLSTGGAAQPPNTEPLFQKKAASFQYVSIQATKRIQVGLFQGMIWQAADSMNRQHLQWQYFNPVIYTNLASYGLNNKNNILIGANLQVKLTHNISLYGQFMADDLSNTQSTGNGVGYQVGAHYYEAFKIHNFSLQAEYNDVTESSYNSPLTAYSNQSYSHYGQNLAYTPGYGKEFVFIADYKYHRVFFNVKGNYQHLTTSNYALYNNLLGQFKVGYTINPAYNLHIALTYNYRKQDFLSFPLSNNTTSFFSISLKTALYNTYYDF